MTGRNEKELEGVSLWETKQCIQGRLCPEVLETFPNKHPENDYFVKLTVLNFYQPLSKTGQPDFCYDLYHMFRVNVWCRVNPWKLYLFSFRDHTGLP